MKKTITIIILTVLIVCFAAACGAESANNEVSTTAVTDAEGQTKYYEYITDENGENVTDGNDNSLFAEIETGNDGTAVTNSGGEFVTKSESAVTLPNSQSNTAAGNAGSSESNSDSAADNEVEFYPSGGNTETTETQKPTSTTAAQATSGKPETTTQSATDSEGWINKWY